MKAFWFAVGVVVLFAGMVGAQVSVDVSGYGVHVQQGGADVKVNNKANNANSIIGPDVQMEGTAVINGDVFIDGEKIPRGKTSYTSKKTKKQYLIHWGDNGNVSIAEK